MYYNNVLCTVCICTCVCNILYHPFIPCTVKYDRNDFKTMSLQSLLTSTNLIFSKTVPLCIGGFIQKFLSIEESAWL
jgi:hypothetical protein